MHIDRKSPRHLGSQVHAPPPHDTIGRRIGTADHQSTQFGLLRLGQVWLPARASSGFQALDARRVVAMHPVAQGLPVHAVEGGRLAARPALQHQRQGEYAAYLRAIGASARQGPQLRTGVVRAGDLQRRAHQLLPQQIARPGYRIGFPQRWESQPEGQGQRGLV